MDRLERSGKNQDVSTPDESQGAKLSKNDTTSSGAAGRIAKISVPNGIVKPSINSVFSQKQRFESFEAAVAAGDAKEVSNFLKQGSASLSALRLTQSLMISVTKGHAEIVGLLLQNDKILNEDLSFAVELAIENNQAEVVSQFLKSAHYDPTDGENEDFIYAIELGHTDVVKAYLQSGRIDPAEGNQHALNKATREGRFDIASLLVDQPEVDASFNDSFILREAASAGQLNLVKKLISMPTVNLKAKNNEALISAISKGHTEVVKLLVQTNKIDLLTDDGKAFKTAAKHGQVDAFSILLDHDQSRSAQGLKLIKHMSKKSKSVARFLSERHNTALSNVSVTIKTLTESLSPDVATNVIKLLGQDKRLFPLMSNEKRDARIRQLTQKMM